MKYDVTIGIPVYKSVDYIEQTIQSALAQTYPNIEYLFLDDWGEDGSMEIVEKYQTEHPRGEHIRIIKNNQHQGIGFSRNHLLEEASGQYFFFLDSDDILHVTAIQRLVEEITKNEADVAYGSWEYVDKIGTTPSVQTVYPYMQFDEKNTLALYAFKNYSSYNISICNCLMNLAFLRSAKLHFIDAQFWEDLAFTYELVTKVRRAVLLPDITYYYIRHSDSLSHYQERETFSKDEIVQNASVISYLKEKSTELTDQPYFPYLHYNLGMNSFSIVCYALKHRKKIQPKITDRELQQFVDTPLMFKELLKSKTKFLENFVLWFLPKVPTLFFVPLVWTVDKLKSAL